MKISMNNIKYTIKTKNIKHGIVEVETKYWHMKLTREEGQNYVIWKADENDDGTSYFLLDMNFEIIIEEMYQKKMKKKNNKC